MSSGLTNLEVSHSWRSCRRADIPKQIAPMNRYILLFILLATVVFIVGGSWGDMDPAYQRCLYICETTECGRVQPSMNGYIKKDSRKHTPYSIPYQIIPLTCEENCNYGCIEEITANRLALNLGVAKYHGHWPFTRYLGLEEPASVVFSILNAVPHFAYFWGSCRQYLISKKNQRCYITPWLLCYSVIACFCWISSAIYHSKKTFYTTQLDLITALAFITFGLFMALRRIFGQSVSSLQVNSVAVAMFAGWAYRAYYMAQGLVRFDSHMHVSIGIVVLTTALWLLWILHAQFVSTERAGLSVKYVCLLCQVWLICASGLEIFDFPPFYGIFDAHSLWHAVTIPLGFLWYKFWDWDKPFR